MKPYMQMKEKENNEELNECEGVYKCGCANASGPSALIISNKTVADQGTLQTSEQRNNAFYVFYGAIHYCQWDTWAYVITETSDLKMRGSVEGFGLR